jgi:nucleotidyltransferase substrate binding protein (TIGR01987 family)
MADEGGWQSLKLPQAMNPQSIPALQNQNQKPMSDIRWEQRFHNYQKAFTQLSRFLEKKDLNEMEEQGLIQAFEYTFELAWKTLQDFLEQRGGYLEIKGPRPVIMKAFQDGYLDNGEKWMEMLNDRNRTVHTYDEKIAHEISSAIISDYYALLKDLDNKLMLMLK